MYTLNQDLLHFLFRACNFQAAIWIDLFFSVSGINIKVFYLLLGWPTANLLQCWGDNLSHLMYIICFDGVVWGQWGLCNNVASQSLVKYLVEFESETFQFLHRALTHWNTFSTWHSSFIWCCYSLEWRSETFRLFLFKGKYPEILNWVR